MKGMIFAAGMGTRLRPLTDSRPKALVEVAGRPMLDHVITRMVRAGITEIVINVHHLAPMIRSFLEVNSNFGINIRVSDESDRLLDTGGGILKARQWLDGSEPFVVHNADIMTDIDLRLIEERHAQSQADATLLVAHRDTSRYILFDKHMRMHGWLNRSSGEVIPQGLDTADFTSVAFGGIHVLSPSIFPALERWNNSLPAADDSTDASGIRKFSIIPFYAASAAALRIDGFCPAADSYRWVDVGRPETLARAESLFAAGDDYGRP